jgi:hypothetical protein
LIGRCSVMYRHFMAAERRSLTMTHVYLTHEAIDRLRRVADERGIPAAAIIRSGIEYALDEVEATPTGFVPPLVRRHLRPHQRPRRAVTQSRTESTEQSEPEQTQAK